MATQLAYPGTHRDETVQEDHFGKTVSDPYRWLENPDAPETKAWVEEQNAVSETFLSSIEYREAIKKRITETYDYPKYSCPFKRGDNFFFHKNEGLQNQAVMYKQTSLVGEPTVFLDPNVLEKDGTAAISLISFSESGAYMAFGVSKSGSDWVTIHIRRVDTGTDLPDVLEWAKFSSVAWTHDDKGFFYTRYPPPKSLEDANDNETKRGSETDSNEQHKVYYHTVGTSQSEDILVYERPDFPKWLLGVEVTDDGRYLVITVYESTAPVNRFFYADLQETDTPIQLGHLNVVKLIDNFEAEYEYITNEDTRFIVKTNLDAPKSRVLQIDIANADKETWKEVLPESENVLQYISCVKQDFLVANYMSDVKEELYLFDLEGKSRGMISMPTLGSVVEMRGRKKDTSLFYKFTSFLYPGTIFQYDFETHKSVVFRATEIQGFDPTQFCTEQVFYTSKDGTRIPMFTVCKNGMKQDGTNPVLLYGYGGFSISITPNFSVFRLVFVEKLGGILAIANIRGGGEYGEDWHKAGILDRKQNGFDDFAAAAQFLIDSKYTNSEKLAIMGGSNGGLLVGASITQRPELFQCAVSQVGVLDLLRFHKFTIGYMWCSDYGNPSEDKDQFETLYKYSPLHNIRKGKEYPALLLTTGDHDDRVVPLHSFKFISQVQHTLGREDYQKNPLLIRIETKAGHGAGKPTSKVIEEYADIYAFIGKTLGLAYTS